MGIERSPRTNVIVGAESVEEIVKVLFFMPGFPPMKVCDRGRVREIADIKPGAIHLVRQPPPDFDQPVVLTHRCDKTTVWGDVSHGSRISQVLVPCNFGRAGIRYIPQH